MSDESERKVSRTELKRACPDLSLERFLFIVDTLGDDEPDALRIILAEENERARLETVAEEQRLIGRLEEISASMLHGKLDITVPPDVSLTHARAILVYGFAVPSSRQTFAGRRYLPREHVVDDVRNKLGRLYDADILEIAEHYLRRSGVIVEGKKGAANVVLYALNINENARGVTASGKAIIRAVKRFMHEHRPT